MEKQLTDASFEQDVIKSDKPVLVDFWAPWCGPGRMLAPVVEETAKEYEGKAVIGKLNTDENPGTPNRFSVFSIPTFLFFKDGELVDRLVGMVPKGRIEERIRVHTQ